MKVIQYIPENKSAILTQVLQMLNKGGTIVYPTETAYALGGDFYSPETYKAIYAIKGRAPASALPVIVPDVSYAHMLAHFSPRATELALKYWPGPLTLVLPFLYNNHYRHHPDPYLAMRVSSHPLTQDIVSIFSKPLISTSANVSGRQASYSSKEVVRQFRGRKRMPDLILDAGDLPVVPTTTLIKVDDTLFDVIRQGSIFIPQLR